MPNLSQVQAYHKKYKPESVFAQSEDVSLLNESFNTDRLEKAFLSITGQLGIDFETYLELGKDAAVALLYIDICSFSSRYARLSADELSDFLDSYYERVIPIIYEYGGEIDRIMGDGIVAVFGPPFLKQNLDQAIASALVCSIKTISVTYQTEFYSKIALHAGQVRYYRNKNAQYPEYTIIGKPITELYRLESIANENSITYYSGSSVDQIVEQYKRDSRLPLNGHFRWLLTAGQLINPLLRGVDFRYVKHIQRR